jgi:ElaB/YqjD/DUF883 family membrane-anchored ribosome-binding protein
MADEKLTPDPVEQVRVEMENTRASLSQKFDVLESKIGEGVQETAASITAAKETITETVQTVQEAVRGTVSAVESGVSAVEEFFDIPAQIQRHPWGIMGGAVVVGFLGERLLGAACPTALAAAAAAEQKDMSPLTGKHSNGHGHKPNGHSNKRASTKPSVLQSLAQEFDSELGKLKNIAVASLITGLHQWLAPSIPEAVQPQVQDIVRSVTQKLGVDSGPRVEASRPPERFSAESRRFARGRPARARAHTIPKSSDGQTRKARRLRTGRPY